jgi:cyclopropane-fatty-acyl-phospholipid synthase
MRVAQLFQSVIGTDTSIRVTAYDGSAVGPPDAPYVMRIRTPQALAYLAAAPGSLGLARAYVTGAVEVDGEMSVVLREMADVTLHGIPKEQRIKLARTLLGYRLRHRAPIPAVEYRPRGRLHSKRRDANVISHHYDVSNRFYSWVLGPSMAYTCAVYPNAEATLEEAQAEKFDLVCRKLDLKPGQRLLDVGCGWGSMVRHAAREYGVRALGVTLSRAQAAWGKEAIDRERLGDLAEVRHLDYRDVLESGFDAISSIGLTEHIGVRSYPAYFTFLRDRLRPEGRLLNHCITRPHNQREETGAFIDRYVFPDGELIGSGAIIKEAQDAGLEVMHEENLRRHYALTLAGWCRNLVENWDECVAEVGEGTARVWGLYMAGSRLAFERNEIQLHQVLAVRTTDDGRDGFGLRPTW